MSRLISAAGVVAVAVFFAPSLIATAYAAPAGMPSPLASVNGSMVHQVHGCHRGVRVGPLGFAHIHVGPQCRPRRAQCAVIRRACLQGCSARGLGLPCVAICMTRRGCGG